MQCSCGAETSLQSHSVKSLSKALEWMKGFKINETQLPVKIEQDKCPGCGRFAYSVLDGDKILYKQG